jgi:hypothetical protein
MSMEARLRVPYGQHPYQANFQPSDSSPTFIPSFDKYGFNWRPPLKRVPSSSKLNLSGERLATPKIRKSKSKDFIIAYENKQIVKPEEKGHNLNNSNPYTETKLVWADYQPLKQRLGTPFALKPPKRRFSRLRSCLQREEG